MGSPAVFVVSAALCLVSVRSQYVYLPSPGVIADASVMDSSRNGMPGRYERYSMLGDNSRNIPMVHRDSQSPVHRPGVALPNQHSQSRVDSWQPRNPSFLPDRNPRYPNLPSFGADNSRPLNGAIIPRLPQSQDDLFPRVNNFNDIMKRLFDGQQLPYQFGPPRQNKAAGGGRYSLDRYPGEPITLQTQRHPFFNFDEGRNPGRMPFQYGPMQSNGGQHYMDNGPQAATVYPGNRDAPPNYEAPMQHFPPARAYGPSTDDGSNGRWPSMMSARRPDAYQQRPSTSDFGRRFQEPPVPAFGQPSALGGNQWPSDLPKPLNGHLYGIESQPPLMPRFQNRFPDQGQMRMPQGPQGQMQPPQGPQGLMQMPQGLQGQMQLPQRPQGPQGQGPQYRGGAMPTPQGQPPQGGLAGYFAGQQRSQQPPTPNQRGYNNMDNFRGQGFNPSDMPSNDRFVVNGYQPMDVPTYHRAYRRNQKAADASKIQETPGPVPKTLEDALLEKTVEEVVKMACGERLLEKNERNLLQKGELNSELFLCCDEKLFYDNVSEKSRCCGQWLYDTEWYTCSNEQLRPILPHDGKPRLVPMPDAADDAHTE